METEHTRKIGSIGEKIAEKFLIERGFMILDRNVVIVNAEIDLIARDGKEIVFVEVKYRRGKGFGYGDEAISKAKIKNLGRAADIWMFRKNYRNVYARFDVVSIMESREQDVEITYHKDAITLF